MHRLKYDGKTAIGSELGMMFGHKLKETGWFNNIDVIVPIPLHRTKELRRGYNQCSFIADGMAEVLSIPVSRNALYRVKASSTQTKKSRFDRTENVEDVFKAINKSVEGKNILLIDDVVTTGATLTAASVKLLEAGAKSVSIATIAIA
jgi:ComF family protein